MPGRFNSKLGALQKAKKVWTCQYCRTQHVAKKPKYCSYCEKSLFYYFASAGEARRFSELALMQDQGMIQNLRMQVPFPIKVRGKTITKYIADFVYNSGGKIIVEDFKSAKEGYETDVFKIKRDLIEAIYCINITISR